MQRWWKACRNFLTAEEVPRWFGLSVVLIYVVGLGSISQFGIAQARSETSRRFQRDSEYAIALLADRVGAIPSSTSDPAWISAAQRSIRQFVAEGPGRAVRLVEGPTIIASTNPSETGTAAQETPTVPSERAGWSVAQLDAPSGGERLRLIHVAVPKRDGPESGTLFLEAIVPFEPTVESSWANQARLMAIVLAVLGALFVVYRCLREQLRSVSTIAGRLAAHRDRIEEGLTSLRINDALDGVSTAWNELVELTERLLKAAQHTEANDELSRVLQRSSGSALAEALHALPDGIVYVTHESKIQYANASALRLLGWKTGEAMNRPLGDPPVDGVGGRILELVRSALGADGNFEARTEVVSSTEAPGQEPSTYRIWVLPLQRPRQMGECLVVTRDVSQQLRADRAREEFIAQVTHELRTPLTNIRAYTETLSSGMFEDPKVITECYNVITKETRRLSRLIEDILSVSQLEVGAISLELGAVDLKALLSDSVRDVRGLAEEKNIDLQLVLPAKLEPIRGDRDKLAVVVNNLLGNAIKYTPAQGNVIVGCQFAVDAVVVTVKDNGIGIDPSEHAKVFEKFQRGSNPEVLQETGTGIGLYTAREIARRHGGEIEVMSERGKGSTFILKLPHRETRASSRSASPEGATARG